MDITGASLIGTSDFEGTEWFAGNEAATGKEMEPRFAQAGPAEVERATRLASEAFGHFRQVAPARRARLLDRIADEIEAIGDALIVRATAETGLPRARLEGERSRTAGQLRSFARLLSAGDWLGVRIDPPLADRKPLPRPELRQMRIPIGPVAVFGASNFPLAFSVAGGDTAAALAAGCPVVVKAHPAHPGTSELVGRAVRAAVIAEGLPDGVFSLLSGTGNALGATLVRDERIRAVGFTGSRAGGLALVRIAAERQVPIPVYAEMSSINPVFLLPTALDARAEALGRGFVASLVMGAGQFCTNPGLVIAIEGPGLDKFLDVAASAAREAPAATMLTAGIHAAYAKGVAALEAEHGTTLLARGAENPDGCVAALFSVDANTFLAHPALSEEVFGASAVVVRCTDETQMRAIASALEGQLTATLQLDAGDHEVAAALLPILEEKAGRILANGWPTGVEVSPAMVHGGPFPATSDGRSTSVGTLAIERFLRPVCWQDVPDALLPDAVRDHNPMRLRRLVDGVPTDPASD